MKKSTWFPTWKAVRFAMVYGMGAKRFRALVYSGTGPKVLVKPPSWWAEPEAFARWKAQSEATVQSERRRTRAPRSPSK